MTRLYARSEGGGRIYEATGSRWKIMTIEEATDGDIFRAYVQEVTVCGVAPGRRGGDGQLEFAQGLRGRQIIEKAGVEVLYLPSLLSESDPIKYWP
jgi:hypothetical protein